MMACNRRLVLAALPALLLLTAAAPARRARPAPPPAPLVLTDTVRVAMVTELGTIDATLERQLTAIEEALQEELELGEARAEAREVDESEDGQVHG